MLEPRYSQNELLAVLHISCDGIPLQINRFEFFVGFQLVHALPVANEVVVGLRRFAQIRIDQFSICLIYPKLFNVLQVTDVGNDLDLVLSDIQSLYFGVLVQVFDHFDAVLRQIQLGEVDELFQVLNFRDSIVL